MLGSTTLKMALGLPAPVFYPALLHVLEVTALLMLCQSMAAHDKRRQEAIEGVTRRLFWIACGLGALTLLWDTRWSALTWSVATLLLLMLVIYLHQLLKPSIRVLQGLLFLLAGTLAGLAHKLWLPDTSMGLVLISELLSSAGAAAFLWAVHNGIVQETYTDPLTGLHNKRFFSQRISEEMDRAQRKTHPLSLVMLDLDHFKRFNDTHGHVEGDRMLQSVGHHSEPGGAAVRYRLSVGWRGVRRAAAGYRPADGGGSGRTIAPLRGG